ncbi:hypothetical protein [Noviherbaspirillum galbum]|uniref:Molecular chaperone DnaJ n=1 Tax=Noviherbaspirillum galbum TaxID=2709383 RepID=A0A6B3SFY2_9BURK|nr:hypothetical protein [Noviherbaspirillum galbum]NEX59797.1 hypothetical protein [Noviherbaspirillum galbum]
MSGTQGQDTRQDAPGAGQPHLKPGDEAMAGTPGTGEDLCPDCSGTGIRGGQECPTCEGSGKITQGIGGG